MKKLLTTLFAISSLFVFAQTPQGINYQSIIRNTGGTVMASTPVTVEFKLYNGLAGVMLYHETHSTTTNPFGMANLIIGQGTVVGGTVSFNNIPWIVGVAYEVYVNSNLVGTKQLFMSVPYALHAATAANAPAPSITFSNNVLSVGGNTVSITTATPYVAGTGINVSGNTITNSAPDQVVSITGTGATTVSGTYPNFTINTPVTSTSTSVPPTITGAGATTVTSAGNTYTVTSPIPVVYTAGTGIDITGTVISNTATAVTPTITGAGAATVTSSGNTFTVNAPAPLVYSAGPDIAIISGSIMNTSPDKTVTINAAGAATVTGAYPNFTVNVPNGTTLPTGFNGQFLYNNGTIWDTLPRNNLYFDGTNFGIGTTSPQADFHVNGAGKFNASVTTPQIYTDNIKITGGTNGQILTSDASGNGTWQSPAAVSSTSLSAGNSNITLNQSGNAYTITPVTPALNTVGNVSIGGAYPNQTITVNPQVLSVANNSVVSLSNGGGSVNLLPATLTYTPGTNTLKLTDGSASNTVILNSTAATTVTQGANVTVTGGSSSYTVSAPAYALSANSNTLTLSNGTAVTTATVPVSTPPSITGTGVSSVTTAGNTFTVNTPMSTYNNATGVFTTGTQTIAVVPTLSLTGNVLKSGPVSNSVTIPTASVVSGNPNITVTPSGNTFSVSAVPQTLSVASNSVITLTGGGGSINITPAVLSYTSGTNVLKLTDGLSSNTFTLNANTQTLSLTGNNLSISGPSGNTITLPTPSSPWIQGAGTVTLSNVSDWVGIGTATPNSPFQVQNYVSFENNGSNTSLGFNTGTGTSSNGNFSNTFVGTAAGQAVGTASASGNSFFGYNTGLSNDNGDNNTFAGSVSGRFNTTGSNNTFFGMASGQGNTTGSFNVAVGYNTALNNTTGINNTFIGSNADLLSTTQYTNATAIGFSAKVNANDALILGNNNVSVGIGTAAPTALLHIINGVGNQFKIGHSNQPSLQWIWNVNGSANISLENEGTGGLPYMFVNQFSSDVGFGTSTPGLVPGASKYLTVVTSGSYSPTSNTSLELKGNINAGNASAARIDFINGLTPTAIARIDAITSAGSTAQGALKFSTNGGGLSEVMRITETGRVGIGTTGPLGLFELALDQGRKPSTSAWTITSDERLKNIEGNYTKGLAEILQLQPIAYHYKNVGERKFEDEVTKTLSIGFSAQEVQKIFPEAVGIDADGYLNFNIHAILIAYTNAIKELNAKSEEQQKTIEQQKALIEDLGQKFEQRLKALEEMQKKQTNK